MWWRRRKRTLSWTASCRDEAGRRATLVVAPAGDGTVVVVVPRGGVAVLSTLAVGQLRAALRDAVFALCDPELDHPYEVEPRENPHRAPENQVQPPAGPTA
jgi:hypothetical protein